MTAPVCAAPPAAAPVASAPAVIPDYGGRDSAPLETGANAPNPAAQAGRAVEALVLVLLGVGGVVYAMKRFGLVQPGTGGKAARINFAGLSALAGTPRSAAGEASPITVEASQALPGGIALHLVTVRGRTLLLGATPQSVQALTEWRNGPGEDEDETQEFEAYLARANAAAGETSDPASALSAANDRLRSLLDRQKE
ncbi:MAG: flagellar biosynthetic protein FliO [Armatimonadota bacterium]|nr:flagellar biosynthetic protein FliO [Armatimonadota bacterium]